MQRSTIPTGSSLQIAPPRLDLVTPYAATFLAAGTRGSGVTPDLPREDLALAVAQLDRLLGERMSQAEAAELVSHLYEVCPPPRDLPEGLKPASLLRSMVDAVADYPPDIACLAVRALIRRSKGLVRVAHFVEAADELIEPRRQMLRGARRLLEARHQRDAAEAEERRWREERQAEREREAAALRRRWGSALPGWFDLTVAYHGSYKIDVRARPKLILLAGEDFTAAAAIHLRRACCFQLAFAGGIADAVALALDAGDDAGAAQMVERAAAGGRSGGERPPLGRLAEDAIRRALSAQACERAALAEGLIAAEAADLAPLASGGR